MGVNQNWVCQIVHEVVGNARREREASPNRGVDPDRTDSSAFAVDGSRIVKLAGEIDYDIARAYLAELGDDSDEAMHTIAELVLPKEVDEDDEEFTNYKEQTGIDIRKFFNNAEASASAEAQAMGFTYGGRWPDVDYPEFNLRWR